MFHIIWILFSGLKFQFALFYSTIVAISPIMITETLIGGFLSVTLFSFLGIKIEKFVIERFPNWFKRHSRKNRILVKIRKSGGIIGICFLTPVMLGIPVGTLLCLALTTDRKKIVASMFASIGFWIIVFSIMGYIIKLYSS